MFSNFRILALIVVTISPGIESKPFGTDYLEVRLNPQIKKYCHLVRFAQGWNVQPKGRDLAHAVKDPSYAFIDYYYSDYQFRVEGLLSTWFLIGATKKKVDGSVFETTNHYRTNLSDALEPVSPVSDAHWGDAAVVPLIRTSIFNAAATLTAASVADFNGFQLSRSGDLWATPAHIATRLSPDSRWVVLQSVSNKHVPESELFSQYKVFFDVFDAENGTKLLTMEGIYKGIGDDPQGCLARTAWLTERYFIIPLGPYRERCLVCEFGK